MSNFEVYFDNHQRAYKFPWSIYHKPLMENLMTNLETLKPGSEVLVIGPGAFDEYKLLFSRGLKVSLLDIDPRVIELHKASFGERISNYYLVDSDFNGYPNQSFDFIYAKEVIEHLTNYQTFLSKLKGCLKQSGKLWLSTPDYEFFLLPLLEKTILEIIARKSGFSRKHIHPTKFGPSSLNTTMLQSGFTKVKVEKMPWRLSLVATAEF